MRVDRCGVSGKIEAFRRVASAGRKLVHARTLSWPIVDRETRSNSRSLVLALSARRQRCSNSLRAAFRARLHPVGLFSARNRPIRGPRNPPGPPSDRLFSFLGRPSGWRGLVTGCGFRDSTQLVCYNEIILPARDDPEIYLIAPNLSHMREIYFDMGESK